MVFGVASMTLTGTTLPSSAKIRVIPSFRPINPAGTVRVPSVMAERPAHGPMRSMAGVHILISMSTPAASDSRISASTVFVDGSMMSMRRLCVRISNCSRPSLCTNGPRMTVYFSIRVGSGTGPATSAPVRCAVSTICSADWSSSLWSYAFRRMRMRCLAMRLAEDLGDDAGADGVAALANREALALLDGDRRDQLDVDVHVVARHDHLDARGQDDRAGHIGRPQVELRPVAGVERRVATTLLLREDEHLGLELRARLDGARLGEHLAAFELVALDAAQEQADVIARFAAVECLLEHLDAGDDQLAGLVLVDADELDGVAGVDDAPLDPAGGHRAATLDAEDILDRHEERLLGLAGRSRNVRVDRLHQFLDGRVILVLRVIARRLESLERGAADHGDVVAGELVLAEELAHLHLDEIDEHLVVDHVDLVEVHDEAGHLHLARQKDVLAGLR